MKKYYISLTLLFLCLLTIRATEDNSLKSYLIPIPKSLTITEGNFSLNSGRIIAYGISKNTGIRFTARLLQKTLKEKGLQFSIAAGIASGESPEITLLINPEKVTNPQGYNLVVSSKNITITAHDEAGLYYGVLTLGQIITYSADSGTFPTVSITDFPDFDRRGVTLDISRCKVPTMESLYQYIDMFASWKINEIQLYTEHTFQYQNHKKVWQDASALSSDEILALDHYCTERFIDLVPNQNGFGHMEQWLKHKEYWNIAENETIADPNHSILGIRRTISSVDQSSVDFIDGLYSELLPNFSSDYINIGGDEPYELGTGKSKKAVTAKGKGPVYLDFLLQLNSLVKKNGKKAQFWGDIILKHPELIKELPNNITCMIWGYRANHPFNTQAAKFKKANIPFYVCPGTSSWRSIIGRTDNALKNQINAAENGIKYGAVGYLNTDWGDSGHPQQLISSYAPFVYGAAVSWSLKDNRELDINGILNRYIYKDPTNKTSQIIYDLGNINQLMDPNNIFNMSFYDLLKNVDKPLSEQKQTKKLTVAQLSTTIKALESIIERIATIKASAKDAVIIQDEIRNSAKLAIHACHIGLAKLKTTDGTLNSISTDDKYKLASELDAIIAEYKEIWMLRNRIGGLSDSVEYLMKTRRAYDN